MRYLLAACLAPVLALSADFDWKGSLAAGKRLEIKGINGTITATPAAGGQASVSVVKRARKSDPAKVEIVKLEHANGVTICAVYPSSDWLGRANTCEPGGGGRSSVRDNDVKVEFTVQVPAGVTLVAKNVNGDITATNLKSDIDADTVNGSIVLSTTGGATAETVNGKIVAAMGASTWSGVRAFETVNGDIEISLPAGASASIEAETVNGEIESDQAIAVRGKFGKRKLNGNIGASGGGQLKMETINGDIVLKQIRKAA